VLFIYETGFRDWNLGYAAAASEILFLLMAIAAMAQIYRPRAAAKRNDGAGAAQWRGGASAIASFSGGHSSGVSLGRARPVGHHPVVQGERRIDALDGLGLSPSLYVQELRDIAATSGVFQWFGNSVVVASVNTLSTLILASLAGYGFARTEFPFKNAIFVFVLLASPFPNRL